MVFTREKKMIRPIRIANDVFSRVRKMILYDILLQLAAPLRTHSTRKVRVFLAEKVKNIS